MTDSQATSQKKIRLGWFSFSCCEDSTIVFTELLNDHWREWKKIFDFRDVRVLQKQHDPDELDIAFVEGAIASEAQANALKAIRQRSKRLVAIGACAVIGMPAGQRNTFTPEQRKEIQFLIDRFRALPKVLKVSDVVEVDAQVPGCPMDPKLFLKTVEQLVSQLKSTNP